MAPQSVAGDLYFDLDGQLSEIKRQLRQPNGYPFDPFQLKAHLQAAIEGRFSQSSVSFLYDRRKDGWKLLENVPRRITSVDIVGIPFLKENEAVINGEKITRRAIELDANYGQEDAEWLLDHQAEIPVELRNFYLVFPGTKWRDAVGDRYVPYLSWSGDRWVLYFRWLDSDFGSSARLVRPRG